MRHGASYKADLSYHVLRADGGAWLCGRLLGVHGAVPFGVGNDAPHDREKVILIEKRQNIFCRTWDTKKKKEEVT